MAVYLPLQLHEIQEIADQYSLKVLDFQPIEAGSANTNYQLFTSQGEQILTLFGGESGAYVAELGQLLQLLAAHDFPTSQLLPTDGGAAYTVYTHPEYGANPVMIKPYIPGAVVLQLDHGMLRQTGRALARLHQIPAPDFLQERVPFGADLFGDVVGEAAPSGIDPAYESWIESRLPQLEAELPHGLPKGLIHGDIFPDNLLFMDGQLAAILDFESALYHDKLLDLAMAILGLCRPLPPLAPVQALIRGYQAIRPLQAREKRKLQLLIDYAATTASCWRFWKFNIDRPMPKKADSHWELARTADAIRAVPADHFLKMVFA